MGFRRSKPPDATGRVLQHRDREHPPSGRHRLPSTCGMHHISRRHGFRSSSAKRRRTISRDSSSVPASLTIAPTRNRVSSLRPSGGLEQAVAPTTPFSYRTACVVPRGARLLTECQFQITFHEASFGPVHRRSTHRNAARDRLVADPGVGGQQDLGAFELAHRRAQRTCEAAKQAASICPYKQTSASPHREQDKSAERSGH